MLLQETGLLCIYVYIFIVLFGPVKPELGVIPSGQENHPAEHLNFPGGELNVIFFIYISICWPTEAKSDPKASIFKSYYTEFRGGRYSSPLDCSTYPSPLPNNIEC